MTHEITVLNIEVEVPVMPSSLFTSCRRSTSQLRNHYFVFTDLEKAFDHVPRKVPVGLREPRVEEWAVRVIQGMYSNAVCGSMVSTVRSLVWELVCIRVLSLAHCSSFWCWRRCHMSSVLVYHGSSSMLMTWCSSQTPKRSVSPSSRRGRLAWKVKGSMSTWRRPSSWFLVMTRMSSRNLASTPVLSAVGVSAVGSNSILCSQYMLWVHETWSGIIKRLVEHPNYICPRHKGESRPIDGWPVTEVDVDSTMLDVEVTFCYPGCYLGDMLCSGGACDSAISARCCVAWGKFRKLLPVLTSRHLTHKICGKVYEACVRSVMLHGSETWGPKECELQQLCRKDHAMIHWISAIKNRDETSSASLLQKLNIEDITLVLRCRRLRWYGHVQWATSCIKSITNFQIPSTRKKGSPWKTWFECVMSDVNKCGLAGIDPLDRDAWRAVFNIAWCCQPHRMGHGQHLNLKWVWMDGWIQHITQNSTRTTRTPAFWGYLMITHTIESYWIPSQMKAEKLEKLAKNWHFIILLLT